MDCDASPRRPPVQGYASPIQEPWWGKLKLPRGGTRRRSRDPQRSRTPRVLELAADQIRKKASKQTNKQKTLYEVQFLWPKKQEPQGLHSEWLVCLVFLHWGGKWIFPSLNDWSLASGRNILLNVWHFCLIYMYAELVCCQVSVSS